MTHFLLQASPGGAASFLQFLPLVGILVVFYFFMIRPQQQRQKKEVAFRESLKKGDKVRTIAGMYGIIESMDETTALLKVDDNVKIRFDKVALTAIA